MSVGVREQKNAIEKSRKSRVRKRMQSVCSRILQAIKPHLGLVLPDLQAFLLHDPVVWRYLFSWCILKVSQLFLPSPGLFTFETIPQNWACLYHLTLLAYFFMILKVAWCTLSFHFSISFSSLPAYTVMPLKTTVSSSSSSSRCIMNIANIQNRIIIWLCWSEQTIDLGINWVKLLFSLAYET